MSEYIASKNTKAMFVSALKLLLEDKPLSKITVAALVRECGCNHNTFYYHFENIDALVKYMLDTEAIDILRGIDYQTDYQSAIAFVLDYVTQNRHLVNCMMDSYGLLQLRRLIAQDIAQIISTIGKAELVRNEWSCSQSAFNFVVDSLNDTLASMLMNYLAGEYGHLTREQLIGFIEEFTYNYMHAALKAANETAL